MKFPGVVAVLCVVPFGLVLHIGITECTFPPRTEMPKKMAMLCYMCSEAAHSINLKMFWQVIPHFNVPYPEGKLIDVSLSVWCPNFVTLSRPGMTFRKHTVIMEINFRKSINIINLNNWTMLIKSH